MKKMSTNKKFKIPKISANCHCNVSFDFRNTSQARYSNLHNLSDMKMHIMQRMWKNLPKC